MPNARKLNAQMGRVLLIGVPMDEVAPGVTWMTATYPPERVRLTHLVMPFPPRLEVVNVLATAAGPVFELGELEPYGDDSVAFPFKAPPLIEPAIGVKLVVRNDRDMPVKIEAILRGELPDDQQA